VLTAALLAVFGCLLYVKALPCAFASVFHQPCPGCGSTRAVLALLRGDGADVLRYNPLGPAMALLLGVLGVQVLASIFKHGDVRNVGEGRLGSVVKRGILLVAVLEAVLWIARFFGAFGGPVPV